MKTDKDLRFLSSCENEDLRVLCDILTHDRLGNIRVTEQLTATDEYNRVDCRTYKATRIS